jgi:putative ABC transport system ATP-binding protein
VDGNWSEAQGQSINVREPLIALQHVSKSYRRGRETVPVFNDLNVSVGRGDFTAITGPSGSGKTTLLNMLGGLDRPCKGAIAFDGADVARMSEGRLSSWRAENVGFIFQFCNLMPMLSAVANVELPLLLTPMGARERRRRALIALDVVGLSDRVKHKPRELSGGQQQRVAIARAVVADPKVILADEPTGDLDRATSIEILEILRLLNREFNKTIVMVTHDPVAAQYADTELHLDKGVFDGRAS